MPAITNVQESHSNRDNFFTVFFVGVGVFVLLFFVVGGYFFHSRYLTSSYFSCHSSIVRYDRGNRGREAFSDRDRERERERPRERGDRGNGGEPIRSNRIQDRDHRDRYANDSRSGKGKNKNNL